MRVMSNEKVNEGCAGGALVLVRCVESGGGYRRKAGVFRLRTSGGAFGGARSTMAELPESRFPRARSPSLKSAGGKAVETRRRGSCRRWRAVDFPQQFVAGAVERFGGLQAGLGGSGAVEGVEGRAFLEEAGGVCCEDASRVNLPRCLRWRNTRAEWVECRGWRHRGTPPATACL